MDLGGGDAVDAAFDALTVGYEHLLKLVEDGGLEIYDHARLVGFLQGWERFRNRLALVDHQAVRAAQKAELAGELCHSTLPRALAATLRISIGEANRRVRAAEALTERMSMTGQPLEPVRPHLAAAQRDGEISAEQVDLVERALAKVDRVGFDPADVDWGEQRLAGWAGQFGPKDLRRLAEQVVDGIDPDGTLPDDTLQQDRRFLELRRLRDGGWAGQFRLTDEAGAKLQAVLGPLAKSADECDRDRGRSAGGGAGRADHGQRMHDALEDVCDRMLRSNTAVPDAGGTPATVIITLDLHDLLDQDRLRGRVRRSLDPDREGAPTGRPGRHLLGRRQRPGVPLQLGRSRRIATLGQTAALIARDKGCSFPGCDTPPEWCERHHVISWSEGGLTDLHNLTLLCRYHHHNFLAKGWDCQINPDGLPEWRPPWWIDRERKPMINNRIRSALAASAHRRQ